MSICYVNYSFFVGIGFGGVEVSEDFLLSKLDRSHNSHRETQMMTFPGAEPEIIKEDSYSDDSTILMPLLANSDTMSPNLYSNVSSLDASISMDMFQKAEFDIHKSQPFPM